MQRSGINCNETRVPSTIDNGRTTLCKFMDLIIDHDESRPADIFREMGSTRSSLSSSVALPTKCNGIGL